MAIRRSSHLWSILARAHKLKLKCTISAYAHDGTKCTSTVLNCFFELSIGMRLEDHSARENSFQVSTFNNLNISKDWQILFAIFIALSKASGEVFTYKTKDSLRY